MILCELKNIFKKNKKIFARFAFKKSVFSVKNSMNAVNYNKQNKPKIS